MSDRSGGGTNHGVMAGCSSVGSLCHRALKLKTTSLFTAVMGNKWPQPVPLNFCVSVRMTDGEKVT